jgi:hypothetical protein
MTPTALCRGGAYFATRQRAGFFVRVDQRQDDGNGKHLVSVGTMDGASADRRYRIVLHNDFGCSI